MIIVPILITSLISLCKVGAEKVVFFLEWVQTIIFSLQRFAGGRTERWNAREKWTTKTAWKREPVWCRGSKAGIFACRPEVSGLSCFRFAWQRTGTGSQHDVSWLKHASVVVLVVVLNSAGAMAFRFLVLKAGGYAVYVLFLLLGAYLLNQLDRYALGATSMPMAQDIKFGDKGCLPRNSSFSSDKDYCVKSYLDADKIEKNETAWV